MTTRRRFIQATASLPLILAGGCIKNNNSVASAAKGENELDNLWLMPEEGEPHERTWMAFGASEKIWGKDLIDEVRRNLATIAQTIARFEPVVICVRENEHELAKQYFSDLQNIDWLVCPLNDLWIRDFGAVFVVNESGEKAAVDFNFNGWGEKQNYKNDAQVAVRIADELGIELLQTDICLEGGGIEVDGQGTGIITESCVLNPNRNPEWSKRDCEEELLETLGLEKIIWLPGVKDADITDGHTDFYARFASPGVVVAHFDPDTRSPENKLTERHLEILRNALDAKGRKLEVVAIEPPTNVREEFDTDDFCAGYINFYVCNDAVIGPEFGDERADAIAREKLSTLFPEREIVLLNIDGIAAGGGGIHCATQQEPKV